MRILQIIVLIAVSITFSYQSTLHRKYMETAALMFYNSGYEDIANILTENMGMLKEGVVSPDNDRPDLSIPNEYVPKVIRDNGGINLYKWEHILPDDIPPELEKFAKEVVAKHIGGKFQYADGAIPEWLDYAVAYWKSGIHDSAMYHLARACHLIQDITVPMHCKLSANFRDTWDIVSHNSPNHRRFERYCGDIYLPATKINFNLKSLKLPDDLYDLAAESRKTAKYCDGIVSSCCLAGNNVLSKIFPSLAEDYHGAAMVCTKRGEEYTVRLIYTFFERIK